MNTTAKYARFLDSNRCSPFTGVKLYLVTLPEDSQPSALIAKPLLMKNTIAMDTYKVEMGGRGSELNMNAKSKEINSPTYPSSIRNRYLRSFVTKAFIRVENCPRVLASLVELPVLTERAMRILKDLAARHTNSMFHKNNRTIISALANPTIPSNQPTLAGINMLSSIL